MTWWPGGATELSTMDVTIKVLDLDAGMWNTLATVNVAAEGSVEFGFKILSWAQ
jgi:hypothetical protein